MRERKKEKKYFFLSMGSNERKKKKENVFFFLSFSHNLSELSLIPIWPRGAKIYHHAVDNSDYFNYSKFRFLLEKTAEYSGKDPF